MGETAEEPAAVVPYGAPNGLDRLLTWPNVVTVARLACLPIFLWLLFGLGNRVAAAALLAALGATDWIDGYLARRLNQTSNLGKILDPVADRLLFLVAAGGIAIDGSAPLWFAVVVLVREALVGGATVALAAFGARRMDVSWAGKAGTFGLMFAFPLFLASHTELSWASLAGDLAWVAAIPALGLSFFAAVMYIPAARRALAEGRAARAIA